VTDDKDFKRLIRSRMAKTGESYTAARAQLVRASGVAEFRELVLTRRTDGLAAHLTARYGVTVRRLEALDVGVFRVWLGDGPGWVARVFSAARPVEQAEGDAAVLRLVSAHGVPAERPAVDEPVSVLDGQAVLVTLDVPGVNGRGRLDAPAWRALADSLGRVHALPVDSAMRAAGAWHHLSLRGGSRADDVALLQSLLAEAGDDGLANELDGVDDGRGLPEALIHPDPCDANTIVGDDGGAPVLVDWTGAGLGPRVLSLANLLAGVTNLDQVDAAMAGYRAHVSLTDVELDRLAGVLWGFPLIIDCWSVLVHDVPASDALAHLAAQRQRADAIAARARQALAAPAPPPEPEPDVHPTLF
jgi:Ser/Thr protein kinase RdoA (MazF antagonist)